jgi:mono/diheme cytochrome c family protein
MRLRPTRHHVLALAFAALTLAGGQARAQSATEGEKLARSVCMPCHLMPDGTGGKEGPAFAAVAAMPSTTGLALSVFLQSSHGKMPNILLSAEDIANLSAYILGLKPR